MIGAAILALSGWSGPVLAQVQLSGDMRGGVLHSERVGRDGSESSQDELRMRLRVAVERPLDERWRFRGRVAGRFGSTQEGLRGYLRAAAPEVSGAAPGDTTLDELYLERAARDGHWWFRVGRFQSRFDLQGVASKSLDRNDSPNMDVNWTDGLHLRYDGVPGWRLHAVLERNADRFPGAVRRPPLDFGSSRSGPGVFIGLEAAQPLGPLVQRMVSVTWLRDALAVDGVAQARRRDYMVLTARAALALPMAGEGRRVLVGAELGHAPRTPQRSALGLGGDGATGGMAWQASVNVEQWRPGHSLGFVLGRADAGWLVSPDFRANDRLAEIRYQWRLSRDWSIEARVRERNELLVPGAGAASRRDRDAYLRLSGRFRGP